MNERGETTLGGAEIHHAAQVGIFRWLDCIKNKRNSKDGMERDLSRYIGDHVIGAIGECAYAKWKGVYWDKSIRTFKQPDVGDMQIRANGYKAGQLILRPDDKDEDPFALVCLYDMYKPIVRGWGICGEIKEDKYIRNPNKGIPCWMIPYEELRPVSELLDV